MSSSKWRSNPVIFRERNFRLFDSSQASSQLSKLAAFSSSTMIQFSGILHSHTWQEVKFEVSTFGVSSSSWSTSWCPLLYWVLSMSLGSSGRTDGHPPARRCFPPSLLPSPCAVASLRNPLTFCRGLSCISFLKPRPVVKVAKTAPCFCLSETFSSSVSESFVSFLHANGGKTSSISAHLWKWLVSHPRVVAF